MGLFDKLFKKPEQSTGAGSSYYKMLDGYIPVFRSWDGQLYENEMVRAAVDARARHISRLNVVIEGNKKIQERPNDLQSWPQFLYRFSVILDMQNTAFAVPAYDAFGRITAFYPVVPSSCEVKDVNGEPWLRYQFYDGRAGSAALEDCIVMTKHQYRNDLFGDKNTALNSTMQMIDTQRQAIEEAAKQSSTYRFMAQMSNFALTDDIREQMDLANDTLRKKKGGVIVFPSVYKDIKAIDSRPYSVNAEEQEVIRTNVFNYFGVNEKVVQNAAVGDDMDAFYNGAIMPFAIQFSEAMSKAAKCTCVANANRLAYMPISERKDMIDSLADRGGLLIDEMRDAYGLPPLANGAGQKFVPIRGEYHDVLHELKAGELELEQMEQEVEQNGSDGQQT